MRSLRIAFLIPVFPEIHNTFILNQITGLLDRGHDVELFPLAVGDYDRAHAEVAAYGLQERVRHVPIPRGRGARAATLLRRLGDPRCRTRAVLGELNPLGGRRALSLVSAYTALSFALHGGHDIVHAQFGHLGPLAQRLVDRGATQARLVVSFRGVDATSHLPRHPSLYRPVFERASLFLPVSEDLSERVVAAGSPRERTVVHRSGIDLRRFVFAERSRVEGEPTEVLFVGRFVEKKGLPDALRAFALARAEAGPARLTLVGSGPLEGDARRLAGELGVAEHVRFLGPLDADGVAAAMAAAHLLLAPSVTAASGDKEGVPNVMKEAMATGMPVLSTLHGGIPELVDDGVSGFLVPERDVPALAARLADLMRAPTAWPRMGREGRAKVEAEFDSEKLNDALVELYLGAQGG